MQLIKVKVKIKIKIKLEKTWIVCQQQVEAEEQREQQYENN